MDLIPRRDCVTSWLQVPGWHQVVVVEHFNEGLDLGSLGHLLLAHGGGDFAGVTVNTRDQGMAVRAVAGAIVNILLKRKKYYRP